MDKKININQCKYDYQLRKPSDLVPLEVHEPDPPPQQLVSRRSMAYDSFSFADKVAERLMALKGGGIKPGYPLQSVSTLRNITLPQILLGMRELSIQQVVRIRSDHVFKCGEFNTFIISQRPAVSHRSGRFIIFAN